MDRKIQAAAISFAIFTALQSIASAQGNKPLTLDEILQRLDANLDRYDRHIPSLFCDEHVVSQMEASGMRDQAMVTDSIYRLKRTQNADHTMSLVESRDLVKVDGKPPTSKNLEGPILLSGWFEAGFALISRSQSTCTKYALQKIHKDRPGEPFVVRFETVLTSQNATVCLLEEESSGRVFIDPETMQIKRLELVTPHHVIVPGDRYNSPLVGKRTLNIDYEPVELGGEAFWLPSTIVMQATSGAGTFHLNTWSFRGIYSNYHKLQVTSRILPMH